MDNRSSAAVVHLMESEIDSGDILDMEKYSIPYTHKTPEEWERFTHKLEENLLKRFLGVLLSGGTFRRTKQDESMSTYWPRLNTDSQAYIDWSWSRNEIISFAHSFDDPYEGASSEERSPWSNLLEHRTPRPDTDGFAEALCTRMRAAALGALAACSLFALAAADLARSLL